MLNIEPTTTEEIDDIKFDPATLYGVTTGIMVPGQGPATLHHPLNQSQMQQGRGFPHPQDANNPQTAMRQVQQASQVQAQYHTNQLMAANLGLDIEDEEPMRELTRDETLTVIHAAKAEMHREGLSQMVFAKVVLGRTPGIVSQMFKFNGAGYEKHVHTIRNFLTKPREERRKLYKQCAPPGKMHQFQTPSLGGTPGGHGSIIPQQPHPAPLHRSPVQMTFSAENSIAQMVSSVSQAAIASTIAREQGASIPNLTATAPAIAQAGLIANPNLPDPLNIPKRTRTILSDRAKEIMDAEFKKNPYIDNERAEELAKELNLDDKVIKIHFKNKRQQAGISLLAQRGSQSNVPMQTSMAVFPDFPDQSANAEIAMSAMAQCPPNSESDSTGKVEKEPEQSNC